MHLVVFGLTITSTWGNGHATLWRGLCRALDRHGHRVTFFERDVPYYAAHRDAPEPAGCDLRLYGEWRDVKDDARELVAGADVAMVTSYSADALAACDLVLDAPRALRVFYDMDTGVTFRRMDEGERVQYIPSYGLGDFDLVLSFTGGHALDLLQRRLGAKRVAPFYGCVDPLVHHPAAPLPQYEGLMSYLGTYAADRQEAVARLFVGPAHRLARSRFILAGSQYPADFPWTENIYYIPHVPAPDHPAFFASSRMTLNVTRGAMAAMGYCPSPRLFEASACGAVTLTDWWEGLDQFFTPNEEILVAETTDDAIEALAVSDATRERIARAARERTLAQHTAEARAKELVGLLEQCERAEETERSIG